MMKLRAIKNSKIILLGLISYFVTACAAIPMATIGSTSVLTYEYYEKKYKNYDQSYRASERFKEHYIPRGPHRLYAREFGFDLPQSAPVIIMLHGFPDSLHLYDRLAPLVGEKQRVITFDFLGWGQSDKPDDYQYTMAGLSQDLAAIVSYIDVDKVSLVLHDLSGPPGIDWALENEEKIDTLYLLNTFYHPMQELRTPEAIALFSQPSVRRTIVRTGAWVSHLGWSRGFTNQVKKFFHNKQQQEIFTPLFMFQAFNIKSAFFQLNDTLLSEVKKRENKKVGLENFNKPVKIIFGIEDPYLNKQVARKFNQIFPNSELHLIDASAHYVQIDQPEKVMAAMGLSEKTVFSK